MAEPAGSHGTENLQSVGHHEIAVPLSEGHGSSTEVKESDPASENEVDGDHDEPTDAKKGPENNEEIESTTHKSKASQPEIAIQTPSEDDHMQSDAASENEVDGNHDEPKDTKKGPENDEEQESTQESKDSTDKPNSVINNPETETHVGDQEVENAVSSSKEFKESDAASENDDPTDAKKGLEKDEETVSTHEKDSTVKPDSVINNPETHAGDQASQPEIAIQTPSEDDHMQSDAASENEVDGNHDEPTDTKKGPENDEEQESTQESKDSTDKPNSVINNPETETHVGDQEVENAVSSSKEFKESDAASENDDPTDAKKGLEKDEETVSTHEKDSTVKPDSVINNPETHAGDQGNYFWLLAGLIVLVAVASLYAFSSQSPPEQKEVRRVDVFLKELKMIQSKFPTQRPELWRRGSIHLKRHLEMERPTEPVSLILTAGVKAEKTLHCLARGLASAYSSALNVSVLHIDGASKAHLDSDQVKLDIDRQLRVAFEGDKPVAVINRFEELPPASTLIFYRYCDHENAAYKTPTLIFTVLLAGEEELPTHLSLNAVEEMVDDHLKKKFLSAGRRITFDSMDLDKYSGLWSRISHLILPVASEETMEPEGCQDT